MSATVARARPRVLPPWRDRAGRFSGLKASVLVCAVLPALLIIYWWVAGDFGPRTLNAVIHETGKWAVRFLLITLAVTPARTVFDYGKVVIVRRMLGVTTMAYALAHFSLFIVDRQFDAWKVGSEIFLRFYLTIGFVALLGLVALGVTSTDGWIRRLGRNWKRLHWTIYAIGVLALFHHFLQSKAGVSTALFAAGVFLWLLLWRLLPRRFRANPWAILALAPATALLTALLEFAWYGLATRLNPWRILNANLDIEYGPSVAEWVGITGVAVVGAMLLTRLLGRMTVRRRLA
jgi:sulfoxide reductase heme-binding subunit YedZ